MITRRFATLVSVLALALCAGLLGGAAGAFAQGAGDTQYQDPYGSNSGSSSASGPRASATGGGGSAPSGSNGASDAAPLSQAPPASGPSSRGSTASTKPRLAATGADAGLLGLAGLGLLLAGSGLRVRLREPVSD